MDSELKRKLAQIIREIRSEVGNSGIELYFSNEGAQLHLDNWETSSQSWQSSSDC